MTREEAINYFETLKTHVDMRSITGLQAETAIDMAIEALKAQQTGKWIIFPPCIEEICMCSNCKTKFKEAYQWSDTCPSCGARMEVE